MKDRYNPENIVEGDVVFYRQAQWRVEDVCIGRCSHRPEDGAFLSLVSVRDSTKEWSHVNATSVKKVAMCGKDQGSS